MNNKMIKVKDTFWNKLKRFFQKFFLRNKNNLTNPQIRAFDEIKDAYNNNKPIEKQKIELLQRTMAEKQDIIEGNENQEEYQGEYKKTIAYGKEIKCYEKDDGQTYTKRYICVGEKEAIYTNANGENTKRFIIYGYRRSTLPTIGLFFTEKVRDKKLDKEMLKTTKQGITENIKRVPLLDLDSEQYRGRSERKEIDYANGNRTIKDNIEILDENGNTQTISETYIHNGNSFVNTKFFNGQVVYQIVRDENGTVIKEYDDKGTIKDIYTYDKDGNPTEMLNVVGPDGKVRRVAKTYRGINHIPDEKNSLSLSNGVVRISEKWSEYTKVLRYAGLPHNIAAILDNTYEDPIAQFELKEFDIAKEQLNKPEQTQIHARDTQEEFEHS